jgi:hypothetical protein
VSPAARLAGFAAVLALVFGGSALAGSHIDAHPGTPAAGAADRTAMSGMAAGGDGHGLAVSESGLSLRLARSTATARKRSALAFRIVDRRGRTVRDFDVEHTKRMHLVVVRRDMSGFQHLHPTQGRDGGWSVPATLGDAGSYRVFADFSVDGRPRTLAADLSVDGTVRSRAMPAPVRHVDVDGLRVTLTEGATAAGAESGLGFTVTRGGRPVAVEDYLGAKGHLVALRQGDLAFLHVHPDEHRLTFMATFPTAGRYRLFLQFKTDGRVHTAAFTQEVTR